MGQAVSRSWFDIGESAGYLPKYEQLRWETSTFLINASSYLILIPLVVAIGLIVRHVNRRTVERAANRKWRRLGVLFYKKNLADGLMRLFQQSYLHLMLCLFLSLTTERSILAEFTSPKAHSADWLNIVAASTFGVLSLALPSLAFFLLLLFPKTLQTFRFRKRYGSFYQNLKEHDMICVQYQAITAARRICMVFILINTADQTLIQSKSFLLLSFCNLIFLAHKRPFVTQA